MSEASVINESCQATSAQTEYGVGSFHTGIDTYAELQAVLDSWAQFTPDDLGDAADPDNITILGTSVFQSAIATVRFSINGKEGVTYLWGRPKGKTVDGPTLVSEFGSSSGRAIIFIPGSGNNEGCKMMSSLAGYTNSLFPIGCAVADSFIYNYPGEDMRGIIGANGLKLIRGSIENYMLIKGTSLHVVALIELAAAMKFMREGAATDWHTYSKIALMGISKGAGTALEAALYTNPTACVSASGFSLKDYRALGLGSLGGNVVPGFEDMWPEEELVEAVQGSPTKFYYTASTSGNEIAIMLEEAATDETATALAGTNFTYGKHSQGHVYPSPGTLNFLNSALA